MLRSDGKWGEEICAMSANLYRRNAAKSLRRAIKASDPRTRSFLRRMAVASSDLAEQTEKNNRNDMVYELLPLPKRLEG